MKNLFFFYFFLPFALFSNPISIDIDIADTDEKKAWGLMGRDHLPDNYGMLFVYDKPKHLSVWMFNTSIDLSVAFINEYATITEIKQLKAYPEIMDPARPVRTPKDLELYPYNSPVAKFFRKKGVTSTQKVIYMLEVKQGWFESRGIKPGDKFIWIPGENKAMIQLQKPIKNVMFLQEGAAIPEKTPK